MTLKLLKIEEGLHDGEVLYHRLVEKTDAEKKAIRAAREKRKKEKEARRREQEKNVKRKRDEKEAHKEKSLKGMNKKAASNEGLPEGFKVPFQLLLSCNLMYFQPSTVSAGKVIIIGSLRVS